MKILDKYILKTFLTTFASVFVILFFIFILQTVWLFISELAGKDLDFILIVKFLLFSMPNIVPMVLPLSILLASIMTFGDLSENYEFAAMKSAGVSLQRAMKGLVLFILILSVAAFAFANNVIPYSQYKFTNFRRNIAQVKPAMAIAEGQFSEVGNYTIKVDKKSGQNGRLLQKITIFKKSELGIGNTTVIKAQRGELMSNESSNILQLIMYNGSQYEDIVPKNYLDRNKVPFAKTYFKKYTVNMDLSKLNKTNIDDGQDINTNKMLNLKELRYTLDSLNKNYNKSIVSFTENIHQRSGITAIERPQTETAIDTSKTKNLKSVSTPTNLLTLFDVTEQLKIIDVAKSNIIGANFTILNTKEELAYMEKNINGHWVSVYDKFVMAYACLLMFFIGAPLGAIIRKGGLGLPIVFAVLIFITFHFVNTFGRKVAEENGISAFLGSWMSSLILTPLAILLTYRATNDIGMINIDVVIQPIQKLFAKLFPQK